MYLDYEHRQRRNFRKAERSKELDGTLTPAELVTQAHQAIRDTFGAAAACAAGEISVAELTAAETSSEEPKAETWVSYACEECAVEFKSNDETWQCAECSI